MAAVLRALPWLMAAIGVALVVAAYRMFMRRQVLPRPLRVISSNSEDVSRVEDDLRAELNRLRSRVDRLEAAANRPIEAVIASYERIALQYGDAAVGKTRRNS